MRHLRRGSLVLLGFWLITASAIVDTTSVAAAAPAPGSARDARHVTLPAGTVLRVRVDRGFGSDISRREDPVGGTLARSVVIRGTTVLPAGSRVAGYVAEAQRPGKVKGRGRVAVRFTRVTAGGSGEAYAMRTRSWVAVARATKGKDATTIAVPAAGGALIGGLLNGKKGAGVGALLGGGAGTATVLATRGRDVRINRGALLAIRLAAPLTVTVDR